MFKRIFLTTLMAATIGVASAPSFAADPSLHEVYAATQAGKMSEALSMMDKVLQDHPNSAKAHYVEAELLAKEGRAASARAELAKAENLDPTMHFANAGAVQELKTRLGSGHVAPADMVTSAAPATADSNMPSLLSILVVGGLLAFLFFAARALVRNAQPGATPRTSQRFGGGDSMGAVPQSYAPAGPASAPASPAAQPGGLGSGLMRGLATGVAVGAGMAAGEALAHNLMGGHRSTLPAPQDTALDSPSSYDMGGNDFGVSDAGSWDDGGGSGGDDWS